MTYTWDDRGNLVDDGTFAYQYNAAGRMVARLSTNGLAQSIATTLVYTSVDGAVTTLVWDWASGIPEMLSDGDNLYLMGYNTLGQSANDEQAYYLPDALGSIRQTTDDIGSVTANREWTPFGVEVGTAQGGLGYTGEWWDNYIKLLDYHSRWFDPLVGRFVSADIIVPDPANPQSLNRYSYCLGNPLRYVDPSGHDPLDENWVEEFKESHDGREPGLYDRLIRLFSIAFPDEWEYGKFYNPDGSLKDDDTIREILATPGSSRTWEGMLPALQRLSAWYTPEEKESFVRDIGSLFGGLPDRFSQPSGWDAVYTDLPDLMHHWASLVPVWKPMFKP